MENEIEVIPVADTGVIVVNNTPSTDETPIVDEDFTWLTERLDAHQAQQTELRTILQTQMELNREATQTTIASLQTQNQLLTTQVETLTANLTRFMEAWELSRLTQASSMNLSAEAEPIAELIPIAEPGDVSLEATPESHAESTEQSAANQKRRPRL